VNLVCANSTIIEKCAGDVINYGQRDNILKSHHRIDRVNHQNQNLKKITLTFHIFSFSLHRISLFWSVGILFEINLHFKLYFAQERLTGYSFAYEQKETKLVIRLVLS
jgi:hypothetical protein